MAFELMDVDDCFVLNADISNDVKSTMPHTISRLNAGSSILFGKHTQYRIIRLN